MILVCAKGAKIEGGGFLQHLRVSYECVLQVSDSVF